MASELTPEQQERVASVAAMAAGAAIQKGVTDEEQPDRHRLSEVAAMAAGAAIQKQLVEEGSDVPKERVADVARAVAAAAIQRGLGSEQKDEKQYRRVESIAKEAAVKAMNWGVCEESG